MGEDMKAATIGVAIAAVAIVAAAAFAADTLVQKGSAPKDADLYSGKFFKSEESVTDGSVNGISYKAIAGTLVVHPADWNDSAQNGGAESRAQNDESSAEASIFLYTTQRKVRSRETSGHLRLQWRPRLGDRVAPYGRMGPKRVVTATTVTVRLRPIS